MISPATLDLALAAWCYGVAMCALGAAVLRL
jgi:hypothetical protein